jgi:hypothetical protein
VILVGVTQTLGTLSRNCEKLAAAQYSNSLKPERFLKKAPLLEAVKAPALAMVKRDRHM